MADLQPSSFLLDALQLIDEHLVAGERERGAVSLLGAGNAFEAWLSFECRILFEQNRALLGLAEREQLPDGLGVYRYWLANESGKVDLLVGDWRASDTGDCHSAFEFKLLHNNKNWRKKADEVWADLFPIRSAKAALRPRHGRVAVIGMVGKVYHRGVTWYPGQREDLDTWESEVDHYLLPVSGWQGKQVQRLWQGRRHRLDHEWLRPGFDHFLRLLAVTARPG